jgi:hypothetical protein
VLLLTPDVLAPDGGACKKGDPYQAALKLSAAWGCDIKFKAGEISSNKQAVDVTIGVSFLESSVVAKARSSSD